ncbi:sulfatase [Planctomycetota bacterium]
MRRRDFLKAVGLGAASVITAGCERTARTFAVGSEANQPNILWLISEDTSPDLGCYGNELVRTPNLDKLAREGALFTNAFASSPVCSPTRSAFMTGMYQTSIGAHQHRSHRSDGYVLPEPVKVITEYFRQAGYFTANVTTAAAGVRGTGKMDFNFSCPEPFDGTDWNQRRDGQPFYAQVNFNLTHRSFQRDSSNPINPQKVSLPPYYPDHPLARRDWADYLESIQIIDAQIGRVLKRLENEGLLENTIVFYFGDHGRPHVRGKQWLYEGGIRIPLIIHWPGHIKPGLVTDELVSSIDFGPTSLNLAGIKVPGHMQGQVFLGPDKKTRSYIFAARDRCDETVDRIRCVRKKRYKYIRNFFPNRPYTQFNAYKKYEYPLLTLMEVLAKRGELTAEQMGFMAATRPKEELYDLEKDPYELHNLADDSRYRQILKELRSVLNEWIEQTGDQGRIPEDRETIEYWKRQASEEYQDIMNRRRISPQVSAQEYLRWWEDKLLWKQE